MLYAVLGGVRLVDGTRDALLRCGKLLSVAREQQFETAAQHHVLSAQCHVLYVEDAI